MTPFNHPRAPAALLLAVASVATLAASAASDSASSAGSSASSAASSASDSLKNSSNSSKRTVAVADGDYRIAEVAALPERPGTLRLLLQPLAKAGASADTHADTAADTAAAAAADDDAAFYLYLPQQTAQQSQLAVGGTLSARQRPYGVAFARADDGRAFFLVLADDWQRELPSHAVLF